MLGGGGGIHETRQQCCITNASSKTKTKTRGYSVSLTFYLSFTRTSFTFSTLPKEFTSQPLKKNNKQFEGLDTVFNPR